MGDPARFRAMADLVEAEFPDRAARIADVAAGEGQLRAELHRRGYRHVTSWDRRRGRQAKGRPGYRHQLFTFEQADRNYDLVVALHPDQATDHAICYAAMRRVPCVVCPCCVTPSAVPYDGRRTHEAWNAHLITLALARRMRVLTLALPIRGRAFVIVARPQEPPCAP
jgi:hypothetical protein